jgi:hypothetical protein
VIRLSEALSAEGIFRLDARIRWAAFSIDGKVMFCEMRAGIQSYTSEAEDKAFMELGPLIMSGVAERLTQSGGAGKLQSVIVNLEKDSILLMKVRNGYLAASANRKDALDVFTKAEPLIQRLG